LMVSVANPVLARRHNPTTAALNNSALRILCEKRIDIEPPLILTALTVASLIDVLPTDWFQPQLRASGLSSSLRFVIRVFGWFSSVRELVLKGHHLPDLLFRQEALPGSHLRLRDTFRHLPEPEAV